MADDDRHQLLDQIEADLAAVEVALGRLDAGSYFTCERCAGPLDDQAVHDAPLVTICTSCRAGHGAATDQADRTI
jgi:RNA polymerase-binding transcription factor DksA